MKWKIRWFVWIAIIVKLTDLITAYFILPGEANPIFLWLGGSYIWMVVFTAIFVVLLLYWSKKERPEHNHYYFCMAVVWVIFLSSFGAWSNIQGILNPALVEAAAGIPAQVKLAYYWSIVSLLGMLPMFLSIVTFEVFYRTRKPNTIEVKIHG